MKQYFSLMDPLRLFAAVWVMNYHYLLGNEPNPALHWYRFGNLGVQIFFIISGFVIVQSIQGKPLSEFALGRFLRLFPLFWILCTVTYLLTVALPDHTYIIHFSDYLRSMTMLSDALEHLLGPSTLVDSSYWTLTVELIFYVMIGVFVHYFTQRRLMYFFAFFLGTSMLTFALHLENTYWAKLLLVDHAAYFVFGGALSLIMTKTYQSSWRLYGDYLLLALAGLYATLIHGRALFAYETSNRYDNIAIVLIHVAMFVAIPCLAYLSRYIRDIRTIKILGLIGALTYPLYLLHQRIGNISIVLIIRHSSFAWIDVVLGMEFCMIIGSLVIALYEPRIRYFLKLKITHMFSRPPALPIQ